jgi:hypothetical protein
MLTIATNLLNIFMIFSRDENDGLVNGSVCSIPAVRNKMNEGGEK